MGHIPNDARAQILSKPALVSLQAEVEHAQRRAEDLWAEHEHTGDESFLVPAQRAQREYESTAQRIEDEVDYWYRAGIVEGSFWSQDDPENDSCFRVFGPFGAAYFTLDGQAGSMLADYLGYDPAESLRETSAWIGDVLWEHRRRDLVKLAELEEKYKPIYRHGATWAAPRIDLRNREFITHLKLLDDAPGCPRCTEALVPSGVKGHEAYCLRCAQGYAMESPRDGRVSLRPLHYDCPGCGGLRDVDPQGPELGGTCPVCGVIASVSIGGVATYADRKAERKDARTGLFSDRKRTEQLQRWRSRDMRVRQDPASLAEAYEQWEDHLIFAIECLPVEDHGAWMSSSRELLALRKFEFTPPDEATLFDARADFHDRRLAQLEKELRVKYPFGPPDFEVEAALKKQYPWAKSMIERMGFQAFPTFPNL